MYDYTDRLLGIHLKPSPIQTEAGRLFWAKRMLNNNIQDKRGNWQNPEVH
jgi:hypothetical protein